MIVIVISVIIGLIFSCCIAVCVCMRWVRKNVYDVKLMDECNSLSIKKNRCSQRPPYVPPTVTQPNHMSQSIVDINPSANHHQMSNFGTNMVNRQPCYPQQPYPKMSNNTNVAHPQPYPITQQTFPIMSSASPPPYSGLSYPVRWFILLIKQQLW